MATMVRARRLSCRYGTSERKVPSLQSSSKYWLRPVMNNSRLFLGISSQTLRSFSIGSTSPVFIITIYYISSGNRGYTHQKTPPKECSHFIITPCSCSIVHDAPGSRRTHNESCEPFLRLGNKVTLRAIVSDEIDQDYSHLSCLDTTMSSRNMNTLYQLWQLWLYTSTLARGTDVSSDVYVGRRRRGMRGYSW